MMVGYRSFLPGIGFWLVLLSTGWSSTLFAAEPAVSGDDGVKVHRDVIYARPAGQPLALDIYQRCDRASGRQCRCHHH